MDKTEELNDRYNLCCDTIEICCQAIFLGRNVERNRQRNGEMNAEIKEIRAEADRLGIELVRRRPY